MGGWATQTDFQTAADRSCDNQKNNCAELANNGGGTFEVGECDRQNGGFSPLLLCLCSCLRLGTFYFWGNCFVWLRG